MQCAWPVVSFLMRSVQAWKGSKSTHALELASRISRAIELNPGLAAITSPTTGSGAPKRLWQDDPWEKQQPLAKRHDSQMDHSQIYCTSAREPFPSQLPRAISQREALVSSNFSAAQTAKNVQQALPTAASAGSVSVPESEQAR